jgi:hypothetical protein
VKTTAPQRISEVAEECVGEASQILALLNRLSDAESCSTGATEQELVTALRATSNALRGIRQVVELEARRAAL